MDSEELSEWLAFDNLYTLPDLYFVAGVLAEVIAKCLGNSKATAADFVPFFAQAAREAKKRRPSGDELKAKLGAFLGRAAKG